MPSVLMMSGLQKASWCALALLAAAYIWMMVAGFGTYGAPFLPIDLLALAFYYLPWWMGWLPLLGVWLLVRAATGMGGRWGWRWVLGVVLVGDHVWSIYYALDTFEGGPNFWAEPYGLLKEIPVALAAVPVGVLAWRPKA